MLPLRSVVVDGAASPSESGSRPPHGPLRPLGTCSGRPMARRRWRGTGARCPLWARVHVAVKICIIPCLGARPATAQPRVMASTTALASVPLRFWAHATLLAEVVVTSRPGEHVWRVPHLRVQHIVCSLLRDEPAREPRAPQVTLHNGRKNMKRRALRRGTCRTAGTQRDWRTRARRHSRPPCWLPRRRAPSSEPGLCGRVQQRASKEPSR